MEQKKEFGLGVCFWQKSTGNFCSHFEGLKEDDIKKLQELKAGDRLIIYSQDSKSDKSPNLVLKRFAREGEAGYREQQPRQAGGDSI